MRGQVIVSEVFCILDSDIVALEVDCENLQDDSEDIVTQSLIIVTSDEKVYHI